MAKKEDVNKFIEKINKVIKEKKLDLSSDEDLSIGIMNLIGIEEHLFFTANKTGKNKYYTLLKEVREMRKELLKKIIKDYEGENWCISKHLLSASMRLMEVGTKQLAKGNEKEAYSLFEKSYDLYSMFWGINLNMINKKDLNKHELLSQDFKEKYLSSELPPKEDNSPSFLSKLKATLKKAIDCCKE